MKEAESLFTKTFASATSRFGMIASFRLIAELGLQSGAGELLETQKLSTRDLFTNPENDRFFVDMAGKAAILELLGGIEGIASRVIQGQFQQFRSAVDAASLVFAHSILDSSAIDYCRATAMVSSESWEGFVTQGSPTYATRLAA